jgi:hypothetical protein
LGISSGEQVTMILSNGACSGQPWKPSRCKRLSPNPLSPAWMWWLWPTPCTVI